MHKIQKLVNSRELATCVYTVKTLNITKLSILRHLDHAEHPQVHLFSILSLQSSRKSSRKYVHIVFTLHQCTTNDQKDCISLKYCLLLGHLKQTASEAGARITQRSC